MKPTFALVLFCLAHSILQSAAQSSPVDISQSRGAFLKLIERRRVALEPEEKELSKTNGQMKIHFTFAADSEQRVTGLLVKRLNATGRRAVVISLHGTGGNKESQLGLLHELAGEGFLAVAMDGRYHGERIKAGSGSAAYNEAIARAFHDAKEHPFYYDTVWDVMRLIDYLATRDDADPKRIGLIGFSKGGIETYLAAAVDPRIAVAVPCIGVQSFAWALQHDAWKSRVGTIQPAIDAAANESRAAEIDEPFVRRFYDRVAPGIYGQFDGPAMLPLIAPRPLLVINGDSDPRTPVPGVMECVEAARKAYRASGSEEKLGLRLQEKTGHKVNPDSLQAAVDWFMQWLKP